MKRLAALLVVVAGVTGSLASGCGSAENDSHSANRAECKPFEFVVTDTSCGRGCPHIECTCSTGGNRTLGGCTRDGCLVRANCTSVCEAPSIDDALACLDTYSLAE